MQNRSGLSVTKQDTHKSLRMMMRRITMIVRMMKMVMLAVTVLQL